MFLSRTARSQENIEVNRVRAAWNKNIISFCQVGIFPSSKENQIFINRRKKSITCSMVERTYREVIHERTELRFASVPKS